jgi:Tfp pilus assembly protein PilF
MGSKEGLLTNEPGIWIILAYLSPFFRELSEMHPYHRGLAVLIGVLLVTASSEALAQTGRIHGKVMDAENNQPIRGATVVAENPNASPSSFTAVSDDKGRFAMLGLRSGSWVIRAAAPRYLPLGGPVQVRSLATNPPMEFRLEKAPPVPPGPLDGIDTKAAQRDLQAARALLAASRTDEAIAAYNALLSKMPSLTMIHLQIGHAFRVKGDFDKAIDAYRKVPEQDLRYDMARVEIGLTELQRGNIDAADRILGEAAAADTATAEALYALGEAKLARTNADEAITWFRRASEADSSWSRPYLKLAAVAANRGDISSAVTYLERAIAIDPKAPDAEEARQQLKKLKK